MLLIFYAILALVLAISIANALGFRPQRRRR